MRSTARLALAAAIVVLAVPVRVRADRGAIAVLPLTASERRLEMYGQPVASAVAASLARATGTRVQVISPGAVPATITWVIDGRIVGTVGGGVLLEARLRDPARGSAAGTVATRAVSLRAIDSLVGELTRDLERLYGEAEQARVLPVRRRLPEALVEGGAVPAAERQQPVDRRPRLVVGSVGGQAAGGTVDIAASAARDAARLAERLGFAPIDGGLRGIALPADVASALARVGAERALLMEVIDLGFTWRGVLSARGAVRFVVVDRSGRAVHEQVARTDTVVGSRGDRHAALIHFVMEQAFDIVLPRLGRTLGP